MANLPSSSSSTASSARRRLGIAELLDRSSRLAVMLVIFAAGLMMLRTFRDMLRASPTAPVAKKAMVSGDTSPGRLAMPVPKALDPSLLQQGAWSLGDNSWVVSQIDLSEASGQARLRSLGSGTAIQGKPSKLEEKVVHWLGRYRPTVVEGCRVYEIPFGRVQVRLVLDPRGGRDRLRLAQLIYRRGGTAQMLEASPLPASAARNPSAGHLLPLPAGVATVARRWDGERLNCELLGPASLQQCLSGWTAAGWTAETRQAEGPISHLVLGNGERRIQLYSLRAGQAGSPAYLLLTAEQ